jgi:hypothetical protein
MQGWCDALMVTSAAHLCERDGTNGKWHRVKVAEARGKRKR